MALTLLAFAVAIFFALLRVRRYIGFTITAAVTPTDDDQFFHRRGAEQAETPQRRRQSLRIVGVLFASAVRTPSLLAARGRAAMHSRHFLLFGQDYLRTSASSAVK
jgi:hypothetical protein